MKFLAIIIFSLSFLSSYSRDIYLAAEEKFKTEIPENILKKMSSTDKKLPAPTYKIAETKVTLTIYGKNNNSNFELPSILVRNPFTGESNQMNAKEDEDGSYVYKFMQYATGTNLFAMGRTYIPIVTDPGENIEIYLDLNALNNKKSIPGSDNSMPYIAYTGKFSGLNYEIAHQEYVFRGNQVNHFLTTNHIPIEGKTPDQFVSDAIDEYNNDRIKEINSDASLSPMMKQYKKIQYAGVAAMIIKDINFIYNFRDREKNYEPVLSESPEIYQLLERLPLNDPNMLYSPDFAGLYVSIGENAPSLELVEKVSGGKEGFITYSAKVYPILKKAETMQELTPAEVAQINSFPKYYKQLYNYLDSNVKSQYAESMNSGSFTILETPDVEAEKIIDAIVAQNKGKVVFVDLWATWCGPCLSAMQTIKPLKPEMKEKDVVIIYITDKSSPKTKWTLMLPEIGGNHYYLEDSEVWSKLLKRYGITGIPSYLIFDKEGNLSKQYTGFPGVDAMKQTFEKIW